MSDPDPRPRPQYGEYATPAQQAARTQQPAPAPVVASAPVPSAPPPGPRPVTGGASLANRLVTIVLLGYGLVTVLSQVTQFLDYGTLSDTLLTMLRVTERLADPAAGQAWGVAAAVFASVLWLGTAFLCIRRLQRGRSAWWIALVAGVVTQIVVAVLISMPLYLDVAVRSALLGMNT